jgi:hypothetical protein
MLAGGKARAALVAALLTPRETSVKNDVTGRTRTVRSAWVLLALKGDDTDATERGGLAARGACGRPSLFGTADRL